ncbi:MAG: low temperature requirement protein A [Nakamurella sp.]
MTEQGLPKRPWYVPMRAREPGEHHRVSTPLELLFDLCFVVAVAQGAAGLDHSFIENHVTTGVVHYLMVFFAIWWAWMNFTWFASAYDNDDVPYRLTVLVQIAGSLVMAAGIPRLFADNNTLVIVIGYVIMRLAMVTQWLRAAASDPPRRTTALRYAFGIAVVQVGWLLTLVVPSSYFYLVFFLLVLAELAVPVLAERGAMTTVHPHHIAERYGLFTVIVLGESVTAATLAFQSALDETEDAETLIGLAIAGIVTLFCLWWIYFDHEQSPRIDTARRSFLWGYGHYFVFASAAAVGAGLVVAVAYERHETHGISYVLSSLATTVPVSIYLIAVCLLHAHPGRRRIIPWSFGIAAALVLADSFIPAPLYVTAAVLAVLVVVLTVTTRTHAARGSQDDRADQLGR